jgi:single-stranded DNA-binding protein
MSATIQLYGRLGRTPERRTTGVKTMVTTSMVVELGRGEEMPEWFSLIAFGGASELLARHAKGDMVSVSGKLSKAAWKTYPFASTFPASWARHTAASYAHTATHP